MASTQPVSICDRLQWIRHNHLWWPAVLYNNYGEALSQLGSRVDYHTKLSLSLQLFRSKNQTQVAQLLGVTPLTFVPIKDNDNESLDFYCNLGNVMDQATKKRYKRQYGAFHRAMDETRDYMTKELQGVHDNKEHSDNHGSASRLNSAKEEEVEETDVEEMEESEQEDHNSDDDETMDTTQPSPVVPETPESENGTSIIGTPIYSNDTWDEAWDKMRHSGWRWRASADFDVIYIKPGGNVKGGVEGQGYFTSREDVQEYAKEHYGWKGESVSSEEDSETSPTVSSDENSEASPAWGREQTNKRAIEESEDEDDNDEDFYVWNNLWSYLKKKERWTVVRARNPLHDWYYRRPGKSVKDGILGEDYFLSTTDVIEYAKNMNLHNSSKNVPKRQKHSDSLQAGDSITPDCQPAPQDPGVPLLSPSDDESDPRGGEDERYQWPVLWPELKVYGWTAVRATNLLHDWYYVRPGRTVKGGTAGVDYFLCVDDVIEHVRMSDERDGSGRPRLSPLGLELEKEASRARTNEENATSQRRRHTETAIPKKKQWWKRHELPNFNKEIWPILNHTLGFRYSNGNYVFPGVSLKGAKATGESPMFGQEYFANEQQMRVYLCKNGIPNHENCAEIAREDKETLNRWATFANVPVIPQNTVSKLKSIPLLSSDGAWDILSTHVGYQKRGGKITVTPFDKVPDATHNFDTLDDLRTFLRASETLDGSDLIQGLSRSQKRSRPKTISDKDELALRLWAALDPTPLPVHGKKKQAADVEVSPSVASEKGEVVLATDDAALPSPSCRRVTMDPSTIRYGVTVPATP